MPALGGSDPVNSLEEARVECALNCAQSECDASLNIISDENFPDSRWGNAKHKVKIIRKEYWPGA